MPGVKLLQQKSVCRFSVYTPREVEGKRRSSYYCGVLYEESTRFFSPVSDFPDGSFFLSPLRSEGPSLAPSFLGSLDDSFAPSPPSPPSGLSEESSDESSFLSSFLPSPSGLPSDFSSSFGASSDFSS